MHFYPTRLVSSQLKKPQGPVTLLEVTHLACLRSLSRSQVGLRGPRALGHVFGKRFVLNRYEEYVRCDVLEHNLVFYVLTSGLVSIMLTRYLQYGVLNLFDDTIGTIDWHHVLWARRHHHNAVHHRAQYHVISRLG